LPGNDTNKASHPGIDEVSLTLFRIFSLVRSNIGIIIYKGRPGSSVKKTIKRLYITVFGIVSVFAGIYLLLLPAAGGAKVKNVQEKLIGSLGTGKAVFIDEDSASFWLTESEKEGGLSENITENDRPGEAGGLDENSAFESLAEKEILMDPSGKHTMYCIGILSIPKIDVELPIAEGLTEDNLKYALAYMNGSAAIGEEGSCCIFGHRSYAYGKFFNRLDELTKGDSITVETAGGTLLEYTVEEKEILLPDDPSLLGENLDGSILSLITCHPVRIASHRLVIRARLKESSDP
jgi:LPXTG-site transpeptidase (sortase) family protein